MSDNTPLATEDASAEEVAALFKRTFGAVILSLIPGGGGYDIHVISGQDHDTPDIEYDRIARSAAGLGELADVITPEELWAILANVEAGGSVTTGVSLADPDSESPMDLADFFRMPPQGRA